MKSKDFLSIADLTPDSIQGLISAATAMKSEGWSNKLNGKILALLFEKPSLRHRASFEVAMRQLGGQCFYLSPQEVGLGQRESTADVARVLSGYVDCIAARTFSHHTLEELGKYSRVPVINSLSDLEHPCQALADLLTIYEKKGDLKGLNLAFIGDSNNVSNSLVLAAALTGMNFSIASPEGYDFKANIINLANDFAAESGARIYCTRDPREAVKGADIVYTDVWTSMGQESETKKRQKAFAGYQVNSKLMSLARVDAIFMHDLPAHRGEEVTDDIMDGAQSVVFLQSENKMHMLKALLLDILGGLEIEQLNFR
ncbi:MAG TPA: ornithine carbamoyltransferase [Dehalococcoidales bacterium]|nr:ornithine carbamoyltransferase [Dehalococcoidales bacterium]